MASDDLDEWEKAGFELDQIKLASASETGQDTNVVIPSRLAPPIDIDFNFDDNNNFGGGSNRSNNNHYSNYNTRTPPPVVWPITNEPMEDVLLQAATNPRERIHVLNLENTLIEFIKSNDECLELQPASNSFRRLLRYRYCSLCRLQYDVSNVIENGERGILIYKTYDTCIPAQLLIDITDNTNSTNGSNAINDNNNNTTEAAQPVPAKKVLVMKRSVNSGDNSQKNSVDNSKQQQNLDKEAAYAAARARIFGGGESDAADSLPAAPASDKPISRTSSGSGINTSGGSNGNSSCSSNNNHIKRNGNSGEKLNNYSETSVNTYNQSGNSNSNRKIADASNWKGKKSISKDDTADAYDPDFVRQSNMSGNMGGGYPGLMNQGYDPYYNRTVLVPAQQYFSPSIYPDQYQQQRMVQQQYYDNSRYTNNNSSNNSNNSSNNNAEYPPL